jgi:predicted 2-oxoglutarate/Fe(II)-dependent dioxygenase YbiX
MITPGDRVPFYYGMTNDLRVPSVNLNAEEYEGRTLQFLETNNHRCSPPAEGGIVFSTSLPHGVTPVTRGRRGVPLTFLHNTAAEAHRLLQQAAAHQTMRASTP